MNKSELLADLGKKVLRVIGVDEQVDSAKNAAGVKVYAANVLEKKDTTVIGRTIAFYVLDEGEAGEEAHYKDEVETPADYQNVVVGYLSGLPFLRFEVVKRHPVLGYCIADVWEENPDDTVTKKQIMAYFDSEGNPAYKVVV